MRIALFERLVELYLHEADGYQVPRSQYDSEQNASSDKILRQLFLKVRSMRQDLISAKTEHGNDDAACDNVTN